MSYGLDAYLPVWLWRVIFVFDILVKSSLIYLSAAVTTLGVVTTSGFEPIVPIILVGGAISGLHFLCLYFAGRFIARYSLNHVEASLARFALLMVLANTLFVASFTVVLSVDGSIRSNAVLSMLVATTNLIPILPVASVAWIARLIMRPRWPTHKGAE